MSGYCCLLILTIVKSNGLLVKLSCIIQESMLVQLLLLGTLTSFYLGICGTTFYLGLYM